MSYLIRGLNTRKTNPRIENSLIRGLNNLIFMNIRGFNFNFILFQSFYHQKFKDLNELIRRLKVRSNGINLNGNDSDGVNSFGNIGK